MRDADNGRLGDRGCGLARARRRLPERQGLRADARWHRLHVGARRAPLPAPRDHAAPARRNARRVARRVRHARCSRGARRRLAVDLGPEAEVLPHRVRACCSTRSRILDAQDRRERLADDGYLTPGWPQPWGRDAKALELLVIEEEFRAAKMQRAEHRCRRVGAADPDRVRHARAAGAVDHADAARRDQSGASSSASPAPVPTSRRCRRARQRVEGGWVLNGQKVWTSMAKEAEWGICLARTDARPPEARRHLVLHGRHEDPRHRHPPAARAHRARDVQRGVLRRRVRPRGLPGRRGARRLALRARTTLANERVYMGRQQHDRRRCRRCAAQAIEARGLADDRLALAEVGGLAVTGHALAVLGFRLTLAGAAPAPTRRARRPPSASCSACSTTSACRRSAWSSMGAEAAATDGDAGAWSSSFLFNRCLTIAGGTSDMQRNVIAERLLGLPGIPNPVTSPAGARAAIPDRQADCWTPDREPISLTGLGDGHDCDRDGCRPQAPAGPPDQLYAWLAWVRRPAPCVPSRLPAAERGSSRSTARRAPDLQRHLRSLTRDLSRTRVSEVSLTAWATQAALRRREAATPGRIDHELTRTDLVMYAGASGDFNPMHHDEVAAQAAGLPSVFGHGMFSAGLLATAITNYVGDRQPHVVPGAVHQADLAGRDAHHDASPSPRSGRATRSCSSARSSTRTARRRSGRGRRRAPGRGLSVAAMRFDLPTPDLETQPFWDGCRTAVSSSATATRAATTTSTRGRSARSAGATTWSGSRRAGAGRSTRIRSCTRTTSRRSTSVCRTSPRSSSSTKVRA